MKHALNIQLLLVVITISLLSACGVDEKPNDALRPKEQLESMKQKWQSTKPNQYQYTITQPLSDRFRYHHRVTWQANEAVQTLLFFDEPYPHQDRFTYLSIAQMFELVNDLLSQNDSDLDIEYDPEFGFPSKIRDGDLEYSISEFSLNKTPILDEYYENLTRWQQRDIRRYNYVFTRNCQCDMSGEYKLDKSIFGISGTNLLNNQKLPEEQLSAIEPDIEDVFAFVKRQILNQKEFVTLEYHEDYGFPKTVVLSEPASYNQVESLMISRFERYNQQELDKLKDRRQQWRDLNLQSYTYDYLFDCNIFCSRIDVTVFVDENEVIRLIDNRPTDNQGQELLPSEVDFLTIEDMFDEIEQAIAGGAKESDFSYHEDYFFPVYRFYSTVDEATDDDQWVRISNFSIN